MAWALGSGRTRHPYTIPPAFFGSVQGHVRFMNDFFHLAIPKIGRQSQPDADGDSQSFGTSRDRPAGDRLAKLLRTGDGIVWIAAVKNDHKFFATITADHVVRAHGVLKTLGNLAEHVVSGRMS